MKILTANDLKSGAVVYRTAVGTWSHTLDEAARLPESLAEAWLEDCEQGDRTIVAPYLMDGDAARLGGQKWRREALRAQGPSTGSSRRHA
jgi:hypothetical protein